MSGEMLATNKKANERLQDAKADANDRRSEIGECHLMLSRGTYEYQTDRLWAEHSLPGRLRAVLMELMASRVEIERLKKLTEGK